jgi:hypothetical protein
MKKTLLALVALGSFSYMNAQHIEENSNIEIGDQLIITKPTNAKHINFPKKNMIIKRGAIAYFENLRGVKVKVTHIKQSTKNTVITLKREDEKPFFRFYKNITAKAEKAIEAGELSMP